MAKASVDTTMRITADGKVYRKGKKYYANKDSYDGEFLDGMRHGKGTLTYFKGNRYIGDFQRDLFHGFGTLSFAPLKDKTGENFVGKRYEGTWVDGKYDGKGLYFSGNGLTYSGEFSKGLYHGEGTLKCANGDITTGEWSRSKAAGRMSIKYSNGDVYEGNMVSGKYSGTGRLTYPNKLGMYDGEWVRGKMHGNGTRVYSNGNRYIGYFREGESDGEGICMYINGDQYIGQWEGGHINGRGVMKYAHGDVYEGTFVHGYIFGYGKLTYTDGGYYEGEFRRVKRNESTYAELPDPDGKRHGIGVRVWTTGSKYIGQWATDTMNGSGTLTSLEGATYSGMFWNGVRHGQATEKFGNNVGIRYQCPMGRHHNGIGFCQYVGNYKAGFFDGNGVFECIDGRKYDGEWVRGKRHGQGRQTYLKMGDAGDSTRLFIGGRGSLYRIEMYKGNWVNGVREGVGKAIYVNGDIMDGPFVNGQPHGMIKYIFGTGKRRKRWAEYCRGTRVMWLQNKSMDVTAEVLGWLANLKRMQAEEEEGIDDW